MNESAPSFEPKKELTRGEVAGAYKKFIEQGIKNPGSLDLGNPEVTAANELFYQWIEQEDARSNGNVEQEHRANLSKTMFYVDAGFTDPAYLTEVLGWLEQDAENAEEQKDNPERVQTRQEIAAAIKKIEGILQQS